MATSLTINEENLLKTTHFNDLPIEMRERMFYELNTLNKNIVERLKKYENIRNISQCI
jgi:hypothetical protein